MRAGDAIDDGVNRCLRAPIDAHTPVDQVPRFTVHEDGTRSRGMAEREFRDKRCAIAPATRTD